MFLIVDGSHFPEIRDGISLNIGWTKINGGLVYSISNTSFTGLSMNGKNLL